MYQNEFLMLFQMSHHNNDDIPNLQVVDDSIQEFIVRYENNYLHLGAASCIPLLSKPADTTRIGPALAGGFDVKDINELWGLGSEARSQQLITAS